MRRSFLLGLLATPLAVPRPGQAWEMVALDRVPPPPTVVAPRQRPATETPRRPSQRTQQGRAPQALQSPRDIASGQATGRR